MTDDNYVNLQSFVEYLEFVDGDKLPGARITPTAWHKHSDQRIEADRYWYAGELAFEIQDAIDSARLWRALVETFRAVVHKDED